MKYLTTEETEMLFKQVYQATGAHRKRDIALFELTKYCALRASEVTLLTLDSYNQSKRSIYCQRLKGSRSNTLKIVDTHVLKALDDYVEERRKIPTSCTNLFLSQKGTPLSRQRMDAIIKHYCKEAKYISPEKWHMHVLRHTRAVELIENLDVDDVQFWLGHKNVQNTFIYLDYTLSLRTILFQTLSALESGSYENRY